MDWERLGSRLTRRGKEVGNRVKEAADVFQLRQKKASAEAKIYDVYAEIGQRFYEEHEGELTPEMQAIFRRIEALEAEIAECEKGIQQIYGVQTCPGCGAEMALGALYCSRCGTKMPEPEPEPEPEAEAPAEETGEIVEPDEFAAPEEPAEEPCCEEQAAGECCCEKEEEPAEEAAETCCCEKAEEPAEEAAETCCCATEETEKTEE